VKVKKQKKVADLLKGFEKCNLVKDKDKRLSCKFDVLHSVTEVQDKMNLNIRGDINDSTDHRWLPVHVIDDANAIILELSLTEGAYTPYIAEKASALENKLFQLSFRKR